MKTLFEKNNLIIGITLFISMLLIVSIFNLQAQSLAKVRMINISKLVDSSFYWNTCNTISIIIINDSARNETNRVIDSPRRKTKKAVASMLLTLNYDMYGSPVSDGMELQQV